MRVNGAGECGGGSHAHACGGHGDWREQEGHVRMHRGAALHVPKTCALSAHDEKKISHHCYRMLEGDYRATLILEFSGNPFHFPSTEDAIGGCKHLKNLPSCCVLELSLESLSNFCK